jgi:hypothetical protein
MLLAGRNLHDHIAAAARSVVASVGFLERGVY